LAKKNRSWFTAARYYNFGISFGITTISAILLGLYGGWWLDRRLGTLPIFLLLGVFLGIGISFYSLWSELKALKDRSSEAEAERRDDG